MPLTCNSFAENTVGVTQRTVACVVPKVVNMNDRELPLMTFLLLVIDSLERLRSVETPTFPALADIEYCDAAAALRNAYCALAMTNTPAFSITEAQAMSIILTQLNEALCS